MKSANEWHMERLTRDDCFCPEWVAKVQRDAFDAGATAMRDRIVSGLRSWWSAAKAVAGRWWPGHPHAVVAKIAAIDVTTTEGRP